MNLKPLRDRVVVLPAKQDDQTTSGLFLPETAKEKPQQGKVVAAGPGARMETGDRIAMDVAVSDTVLYVKYAGATVKLDNQEWNWTNWVLSALCAVLLLQSIIRYGVGVDWWALHAWYWWVGV